jgi:hypothetical protein
MITENLKIICDGADKVNLVTNGQGNPEMVMYLDDVNIDELMTQLAVKCDAHTILDHLHDEAIAEYMVSRGYSVYKKVKLI